MMEFEAHIYKIQNSCLDQGLCHFYSDLHFLYNHPSLLIIFTLLRWFDYHHNQLFKD